MRPGLEIIYTTSNDRVAEVRRLKVMQLVLGKQFTAYVLEVSGSSLISGEYFIKIAGKVLSQAAF